MSMAEKVLTLVGVDSGGLLGWNFCQIGVVVKGDRTLDTVVARTDRLAKETVEVDH